jgi:hypothetical protein
VTMPPRHCRVCVCAGRHAAMGRRGPLTRGRLNFSLNFEINRNLKFNMTILPMSKSTQIFEVYSMKQKEQLYLLDQLQIPSGLYVINSGTNSNLNLP